VAAVVAVGVAVRAAGTPFAFPVALLAVAFAIGLLLLDGRTTR
jgi:hypothetical protein